MIVSLHPDAREDLYQAAAWYEDQRSGMGGKFLQAVRLGIRELETNPDAGWAVDREMRMLTLKRFPYGIVFRVADSSSIRILAIHHHSRNRRYWRSRRDDL